MIDPRNKVIQDLINKCVEHERIIKDLVEMLDRANSYEGRVFAGTEYDFCEVLIARAKKAIGEPR